VHDYLKIVHHWRVREERVDPMLMELAEAILARTAVEQVDLPKGV
jgi:hypothetical protein